MADNLKKRVLQSTAIILGGDGLVNVIRLISNLILTRLLVPEMFGLMAIANVVIMALAMFSDIGVGMFVIRSTRALDQEFLNTAWTLKVLRGFVLWGITLVVAKPAALIYNEPLLLWMIPLIGIDFVFDGFQSMSMILLRKELKMGRLIIMNLAARVSGLVCMVVLAYIYRNVWALVVGGLVAALVNLVWSFFLDRNLVHKFAWDKSVASEILHYGKWIFLSTSMMFLATQADRLLLGKLFPLALLGIYSIALNISQVPKNMVGKVSGDIIFPVISMYAHLPRPALRHKILQKRKFLLVPLALLVAVLTGFGDLIINVLYDNRYVEAGWMLPLLALGMWPLLLYSTIDRCLYVVGNPTHPAVGNALKFIYMVTCLPLAFFLTGKLGAVLVVAFNDFPVYVAINYGLRKKGLSGLRQDLWTTGVLLAFLMLFFFIRSALDLGFPGYAAFHAPMAGV